MLSTIKLGISMSYILQHKQKISKMRLSTKRGFYNCINSLYNNHGLNHVYEWISSTGNLQMLWARRFLTLK